MRNELHSNIIRWWNPQVHKDSVHLLVVAIGTKDPDQEGFVLMDPNPAFTASNHIIMFQNFACVKHMFFILYVQRLNYK